MLKTRPIPFHGKITVAPKLYSGWLELISRVFHLGLNTIPVHKLKNNLWKQYKSSLILYKTCRFVNTAPKLQTTNNIFFLHTFEESMFGFCLSLLSCKATRALRHKHQENVACYWKSYSIKQLLPRNVQSLYYYILFFQLRSVSYSL